MDNVNFSWYIYPGDNWSGLPNITNATVTNGVLNSYTINTAPLVVDAFNRAAQIVTQQYDLKAIYKGDNFDLTTDGGFTRATGGTQHQFFAENFVFASANINESQNSSSFGVTSVAGDPTAAGLNSGADFATLGAGNFYGNIASNPEVDTNKWVQVDLVVPLKGALKNLQAGMRFSDEKSGETGLVVSVPDADAVNTQPRQPWLLGPPEQLPVRPLRHHNLDVAARPPELLRLDRQLRWRSSRGQRPDASAVLQLPASRRLGRVHVDPDVHPR